MKSEINESALLEGLAANDKKSVETIYQQNYNMVQSLIINNNGSAEDAKDIFQEAMIVLYEKVRAGNFELLPGDETRPRNIFSSYQALLLEVAQAMDEASGAESQAEGTPIAADPQSPLMGLTRFNGVQFVVSVGPEPQCEILSWGLETPDHVSEWTQKSLKSFSDLGDKLKAGPLQQLTAMSADSHVALADSIKGELCVGFRSTLRSDEVRESMRNILAKWAA